VPCRAWESSHAAKGVSHGFLSLMQMREKRRLLSDRPRRRCQG
jgi:hypothetical protein